MNKLSKIITATILVLMSFINTSWAQDFKLDPTYFHIFDKDSLKGFEEDAARASAISEQYLGAEFKVKMYQLKRAYINNRYNLWPKPIKNSPYSVILTSITWASSRITWASNYRIGCSIS